MFRAHAHSSSICSALNRSAVVTPYCAVARTVSAREAQNTSIQAIQRPSARLSWSLVGGLAAKARGVNKMAANATQGDVFPPNQATDEDYEMMAALSSIPSIGSAWAGAAEDPEYDEVSVLLAHRDFARNTAMVTSRTIMHKGNWAVTSKPSPPIDAAAMSRSPSGASQIICRAGTPQVWEIWTTNRKACHLEVPEDVHGSVFSDGLFGHGFNWSEDEHYVAYVAEDAKSKDDSKVDSKTAEVSPGGKSLQKKVSKDSKPLEDWGEKHNGKRDPKVFVLDLKTKTIQKVAGQKCSSTYGQPQWTPEGGLLMVEWPNQQDVFPHLKFKVGLSYCFNRNCAIVYSPIPLAPPPTDGTATSSGAEGGICVLRLDPPLMSSQEPRLSPDGGVLVFTCHDQACKLQTHSASLAIHKTTSPWADTHAAAVAALGAGDKDYVTVAQSQLVPESPLDSVPSEEEFPGVYSANLAAMIFPKKPFVGSSTVLINTLWRDVAAVAAVSVDTGEVLRLSPDSGSFSVLLNTHSCILAASSSLGQLPQLHKLAYSKSFDPKETLQALKGGFQPLGNPMAGISLPETLQDTIADVSIMRQSTVVDEATGARVQSLVYRRKSLGNSATPGVVLLHGGPHSAAQDAFAGPLIALVAEGYTIVVPNYRGSTGFGDKHLAALPGQAGTMDVQDCHAALQATIAAGLIDGDRVVVTGGSHGGFLTGHLVGQYPGLFKAAVMRNPVLNLPLMVHLSDIPDWCSVEVDGCSQPQEGASYPPSQEAQARMYAASPIAYIDAVDTPVMLMLGLKDRRVPPPDGLAYARALRSRGKPVEVHTFEEDAHPLDKPETAFVQWPRILAFFRMHIGKQ